MSMQALPEFIKTTVRVDFSHTIARLAVVF